MVRRRCRVAAAAVALAMGAVAAGGCVLDRTEMRPMAGPAPQQVLVAPVLVDGGSAMVARRLPGALAAALRRRGFPAADPAASHRELQEHGMERAAAGLAPGLPAVGLRFGVDAVAQAEVELWRPRYDREELIGLDYRIVWRLVSVDSGFPIWAHETSAQWSRPGRFGTEARSPWREEGEAGGLPPPVAQDLVRRDGGRGPATEAGWIDQAADAAMRALPAR